MQFIEFLHVQLYFHYRPQTETPPITVPSSQGRHHPSTLAPRLQECFQDRGSFQKN